MKKLMSKFPGVDRHVGSKSPKAGSGQMAFGQYSPGLCGKMHGKLSPGSSLSGKKSPLHPQPTGGKKPRTGV